MDICNCVILYVSALFVACGGVLTGETGTLTFTLDWVKRLSVCNSLCFCYFVACEGVLTGETGTLTFPMDKVKRLSVCNSLCFCVIL